MRSTNRPSTNRDDKTTTVMLVILVKLVMVMRRVRSLRYGILGTYIGRQVVVTVGE